MIPIECAWDDRACISYGGNLGAAGDAWNSKYRDTHLQDVPPPIQTINIGSNPIDEPLQIPIVITQPTVTPKVTTDIVKNLINDVQSPFQVIKDHPYAAALFGGLLVLTVFSKK